MATNQSVFKFSPNDIDDNKGRNKKMRAEKNNMRNKLKEWGIPEHDAFEIKSGTLQQLLQDPTKTAELVSLADKIGAIMKSVQLTTSQIRNIFGTVRRIEMSWPHNANPDDDKTQKAMRELLLLKPRLAYQAKRTRPVEWLADILTPMIDYIEGDRERFQRFVDFFEAILAYHRHHGGADK